MTSGRPRKRLVAPDARPTRQGDRASSLLAVVSVALTVARPADPRPRHRPDLRRPDRPAAARPGRARPQAVDGSARSGDDQLADMLAGMDVVPGHGVDFAAVGARAAARARGLRRRRRCSAWLQGYLLNDVVQSTVRRMRADVEDKVNRLPLSYFDRQPRGELLSRVTNDIDNVSQTLQQTMSQLLTSLLTVVGVLAMMFWISPLLALVALVTVPLSMLRDRRGS